MVTEREIFMWFLIITSTVTGFIIAIASYLGGLNRGYNFSEKQWRQILVNRGLAEWAADINGVTTWRWK